LIFDLLLSHFLAGFSVHPQLLVLTQYFITQHCFVMHLFGNTTTATSELSNCISNIRSAPPHQVQQFNNAFSELVLVLLIEHTFFVTSNKYLTCCSWSREISSLWQLTFINKVLNQHWLSEL
jgi:hypothetical protein